MDVTTLGVKVKSDGIEKTNRDLDKLERNSKGASTATGKLQKSFVSLKGALAGLGFAGAIRSTAQVGLEFQRMERALATATGSTEAARKEIQFLTDEAERLGTNLLGTGKAFSQLTAASIGTRMEQEQIREIFTAVSEASTVLGLSASDSEGAVRALSQMMSKGTVQAEELRGQLGERIPGAFQIAARSMGVTTQELGKMLEQGEVIADDFLPKFATEMRKTFGSQVPEAVDSAQAAFNRLDNAVAQLQKRLADGGILSGLATSAEYIVDIIGDVTEEIANVGRAAGALSVGDIDLFDILFRDTASFTGLMNDLEAQNYNAAVSFEELAQKMEETAAQTSKAERAANSLNAGALSKTVSLIKQQVPALQDTIAAWDKHISTLRGKYSDTLQNIATQEQNLANIRRGNSDMIRELENRNLPATVRYYDEVRALERQTAEASKLSGDAKVQELQRINQEWFNLSGAVRENGEDVISQEEATGRALAEIRANAEAMEEAKQAQIEASKEQLNTLATSISEAEKQVAQYRKELDGLQKQTAELAQTTQVNIDTGQATSAVQKLNAELQKLLQSMAQAEGTQYAQPPAESGDYSSGGYTGRGGVNQPAGIVHKGEVVFSQSDVARAGGVAAVEAMRRGGMSGYATGGVVGYVQGQYGAIDQELQGYQTYDELITSDFSRRLQSFREHALRWYSAANQAQLMYAEQQYRGRMNELYNQQQAAQNITQNTGDQSTNYNVTVNSSANSGDSLARELLPAIQKLQQRRITIE
jgi:tape measure domain-containing protein